MKHVQELPPVKVPEITDRTQLISASGGSLDICDDETGEILASVAVPPGAVRASVYTALLLPGQHLEVAGGIVAMPPRRGYTVNSHPDFSARDDEGEKRIPSGANPDYVPTIASRNELAMRLAISRMNSAAVEAERRVKAMGRVETIPVAKPAAQPDPEPVVE